MSTVLPINSVLDELRHSLSDSLNTLLIAEPGAGKTTRVPLALLEAPWLGRRRILMLEPRRIAARNAATFMASQLGEAPGQTVGYRIRGEQKTSAATRIEVVTEGILTRMLQDDPELSDVALVIFDEFHERHLNSDLGLALCLQCQQIFNPELRLLIMSATLDEEQLATMLNAPVVRSEGRHWPVTLHYRPARDANERLASHAARVAGEALRETDGDILMFLPGTGDIQRTAQLLEGLPHALVLPLHGQLSDKEQKRVLAPAPGGQRKIILATNIAESSLTIDGVRTVIDSTLERRMVFRPGSGLSELVTQGISQASATQRMGRAGRQAPGVCYRLCSESSMSQRPAHIRAEISECDLLPLSTELLQWGTDADELSWLTPPPPANLSQASDQLARLGFINDRQMTDLAREALPLGTDARLAAMMIAGKRLGMGQTATELAALLQEPALLRQRDDISLVMPALRQQAIWQKRIAPLARRWQQQMKVSQDTSTPDIALLLACAFPERIARVRSQTQPDRYLLASGAGAELAENSALRGEEWLVCAEVTAGQPNRIRVATPLTASSLETYIDGMQTSTTEHVDIRWTESGQLLAEKQTRLGALVLHRKRITDLTNEDWLTAWRELLRKEGLTLLNWDDSALQLRARLALAAEDAPGQWPDVSDSGLLSRLDEWLEPYLTGVRNLRALQKVPVKEALLSLLDWDQQQSLKASLPTHLTVPSGSSIQIDYSTTPPVLAVKLQEMFGYEGQPSVLNGRLPLMLHLLSPARRPLQVTQDLPHFWRNTYADVRKDMRGRYPKHPWPEDPMAAEATRYTKRRT